MTTFVTGGTGFIGVWLVRQLLEQGDDVVCFDIAPDRELLADVVPVALMARVSVLRGDVSDWTQVLHAMREHGVDRVVHLASLLASGASDNFPLTHRVNCGGTNNIFEAAVLLGLGKVVWASSVAVFGPRSAVDGVVHNDAVHDPQELYGVTKSFNERMAQYYIQKYGMDITAVRFPLVYGYGKAQQSARGTGAPFVTDLFDKPALGQGPSTIPGGGSMDWLYVEDCARSLVLALAAKSPPTKAFTIVGDVRSIGDVLNYVRSLLPDATMTLTPAEPRPPRRLDGSVAKAELGYEPVFCMEEGVRKTINLLRQKAGMPAV